MTAHAHNILALDLGTHTGWAIRDRDGDQIYGTIKFPNRKKDHPGQRWRAFRAWLFSMLLERQIHILAYEDVRRHEGTSAAHVYGAFLALTQMVASPHGITLLPVGVGVIKKAWTGRGNASKQDMIAEAHRRGFKPDTDNAADALAILDWAVTRGER